jgi:anti-sigma B factor antagonist
MDISITEMKRCQLVKVSGRVDSATAPELEKTLMDLIEAGKKHIVVNLADVDYISSAGMKALLWALMKVRKLIPAGDVVISQIKPKLKETFELIGFTHLFKFYDDDLQAVGSF